MATTTTTTAPARTHSGAHVFLGFFLLMLMGTGLGAIIKLDASDTIKLVSMIFAVLVIAGGLVLITVPLKAAAPPATTPTTPAATITPQTTTTDDQSFPFSSVLAFLLVIGLGAATIYYREENLNLLRDKVSYEYAEIIYWGVFGLMEMMLLSFVLKVALLHFMIGGGLVTLAVMLKWIYPSIGQALLHATNMTKYETLVIYGLLVVGSILVMYAIVLREKRKDFKKSTLAIRELIVDGLSVLIFLGIWAIIIAIVYYGGKSIIGLF